MHFLYLLAPPLSAAVKATAQGSFTKKRVTTFSDAAAFNALVFAFTAVIFSSLFVRELPSLQLLAYAALSAVFIAGFQFSYTLAFKNGAVAPAVIINTFNVIFPLLTGAIFYEEKWTLFTAIGCACMAAAFYLVPARGNDKKINGKWVVFTIAAFVFAGLNNSLSLVFSKSGIAENGSSLVAFSYAFAFPLAAFAFAISKRKEKHSSVVGTLKPDVTAFVTSFAISALLGANNLFTLLALGEWQSNVFFPISNGATIVFTVAFNFVLYREKPALKSIIGIVFAIIAVILLNLS